MNNYVLIHMHTTPSMYILVPWCYLLFIQLLRRQYAGLELGIPAATAAEMLK